MLVLLRMITGALRSAATILTQDAAQMLVQKVVISTSDYASLAYVSSQPPCDLQIAHTLSLMHPFHWLIECRKEMCYDNCLVVKCNECLPQSVN